ncbi:hypothetical protein AAVH_19222 [Aphelenchoides avenae]|nr:hypothetical protein AAVH_19222 [Aphelenchus avenae]
MSQDVPTYDARVLASACECLQKQLVDTMEKLRAEIDRLLNENAKCLLMRAELDDYKKQLDIEKKRRIDAEEKLRSAEEMLRRVSDLVGAP